eukprot:3029356-Rhodomonas_salina.1
MSPHPFPSLSAFAQRKGNCSQRKKGLREQGDGVRGRWKGAHASFACSSRPRALTRAPESGSKKTKDFASRLEYFTFCPKHDLGK